MRLPHGSFEGYLHGSEVSVIFSQVAQDGSGPRLHRHPYSETADLYEAVHIHANDRFETEWLED